MAALLVLMVTWFNEEIPGLPPASPTPVEVAGGRTSASYLFVANGTFLNVTIGVVCAECPFAVAPSSTFGYALTLTNSFNGSLEVQLLTAVPPFHLDSLSLSVPFLIAPGLSEAVDHTLVAPPIGGTAVIPLVISADVG